MKLTAPQHRILTHAARCCDEYDGICPNGGGQWQTFRALEKLGLLKWVGPAECGDGCERAGDCPHPVQLYTLSDKGHDYIESEQCARAILSHDETGEGL